MIVAIKDVKHNLVGRTPKTHIQSTFYDGIHFYEFCNSECLFCFGQHVDNLQLNINDILYSLFH